MLYRVGRNTISDIASQLSGTGIVILASHNCHGEAELMSDLIKYNDSLGLKTHVWDLYDARFKYDSYVNSFDPEVLRCRMQVHKIPMLSGAGAALDVNQLFRDIISVEKPDVVLLIGLQMMQIDPNDTHEAELLMERIRASAEDRSIVVYSRLDSPLNKLDQGYAMTEEEYAEGIKAEITSVEKLEKLGIKADRVILIDI